MKKLVILQFDGDFSTGFKIILEIGDDGKRPSLRIRGELPQSIVTIDFFHMWRDSYRSLYGQTRIKLKGARNVNIETLNQKCSTKSEELLNSFNTWLDSKTFRTIKNCLEQLQPEDEIRVIICTDCQELRQLPWHLWEVLQSYSKAEVALSGLEAKSRERSYREKIRILIILGDSTDIDVEADRKQLQKYCGDAEIVLLKEPSREELNEYLQDNLGWDILFFSGHSQTVNTKNPTPNSLPTSEEGTIQGRIFLNHHDSLTMGELKDALQIAIAKRLQVAFFNSCDGLGIASELEKLDIPQVIVMREPVPDKVAQMFLKYFLLEFTGGKPLYISVGNARKKLQNLETRFPCASWLPVIVQNLLETPPTWQSLGIVRCPYKGLMAFREEDAEYFFGREAFVEQLVADVTRKPLVAVIGASGSGKSSVVCAGLIPQLRQDCEWQIIYFRPGNNPFESLAVALLKGSRKEEVLENQRSQELELEENLKNDIFALQNNIELILRHCTLPTQLLSIGENQAESFCVSPSCRILLIVDQFEEIYTLCPDANERQIFIDGLLNAVSKAPMFTLVLTLRADFLGKAMSYQPLGKALQDYPPSLLIPMNREELERAITQPAASFSVELEEGLVNKLINDVGSGEGSLPLQQFALTQLWAKQRPGFLTYKAYKEIGGVTQALANHAEDVYAKLSEEQREQAQRVFIQLVQPGEGTEDTRRLATSDEVGEDNWGLVTVLASERLVVTNRNELIEDTVEIVHEALIGNWGRLQRWMDDNREFRTWQERLKVALQQWVDSNKDDGALLRGAPLAVAEDWLLQRGAEVSQAQRRFIEKSVGLHEKERKQRKRLRRSVTTGLICGIVIISGFAGVSEIRRTDSEVGRLSSSAEKYFNINDHEAALTEIIKAGKILKGSIWKPWIVGETQMQATSTLREVVYGYQIKTFKGHTDGVTSVSFSADGKKLASAFSDGTVKLWDINTGSEIKTLTGHIDKVTSISFSPDGKTLASASKDNTVILWNFDLDDLLVRGCKLIRNYLQNNLDVSAEDKRLCDGIKH